MFLEPRTVDEPADHIHTAERCHDGPRPPRQHRRRRQRPEAITLEESGVEFDHRLDDRRLCDAAESITTSRSAGDTNSPNNSRATEPTTTNRHRRRTNTDDGGAESIRSSSHGPSVNQIYGVKVQCAARAEACGSSADRGRIIERRYRAPPRGVRRRWGQFVHAGRNSSRSCGASHVGRTGDCRRTIVSTAASTRGRGRKARRSMTWPR